MTQKSLDDELLSKIFDDNLSEEELLSWIDKHPNSEELYELANTLLTSKSGKPVAEKDN